MSKVPFQDRLNQHFAALPDRISVQYGGLHLTYAELENRSKCVTGYLEQCGAQAGSFIGIFLEDRIDIIAAMTGILNARCVFVILDTQWPQKRIETLIRSTGIKIVLRDNSCFRPIPEASESTPPSYDREDQIYIYFTSGTTGTPKAMLGRNKSLLHFIDWEIETFSIDTTYRTSQLSAPGFDAFLRDVFTPLCAGATVCIPGDAGILLDRQQLVNWLESRCIILVHCVPSVLRIIGSGHLEPGNFKTLNHVLLSGERIVPAQLTDWFDAFGERIQLVNLYGTSETTMAKTCYFIKPSDARQARVSAGKPIRGARVFVLNENLEPCSTELAGEIYIRTPFRTFGYYNDPEANRERFIPNPFTGDANDLFHRTGDLGRIMEDGNLDVLGRVDRQVKIRGVRVEPEEIESILSRFPSVREAAVVNKEDPVGDTYLCAYYVLKEETEAAKATEEELRDHLSSELPEYMVPLHFIPMPVFPLTPNGKVDRAALPEPRIQAGDDYAPPRNDREKTLVEIWSGILGIDPEVIGIDGNFFRLRGHSLRATVMVEAVHERLNVRLPLSQVFKTPTVRELSRYIAGATQDRYVRIEAVEEKEYYPLSPAQHRLFFIHQMKPGSLGYNMPRFIPLEGAAADVDIKQLEEVFVRLIRRHESLRTSFELVADRPVQRVHREVQFKVEHHPVDEPDIQRAISRFIRPFDISRAPLLRVWVIGVPGQHCFLLMDMHHIITDGSSQDLLAREFHHLSIGEELEPLTIQCKDYSQWQNSKQQQESVKRQRDYWLTELSGELPVLDLPVDRPRPPVQEFDGIRVGFDLNANETGILKEIVKERDVTLYMALLAIFNILFSKLSGQEDIVIGTPIAARRHADLERVVAMMVNTLAMRNYPAGHKTFNSFLTEVKQRTLEAYENQDYQFEDLVNDINIVRDVSRNPVFDVMLNLLNQADYSAGVTEDAGREEPSESLHHIGRTSRFDMMFGAVEGEDIISFYCEYSTVLFEPNTISRFVKYLKKIIRSLPQLGDRALSEIEIITAEEKEEVLRMSMGTEETFDEQLPGTVHGLFEVQAEKTPGHVALVSTAGDGSITYRLLNERADQLASMLRENGVQPGSIVAVMVERSIEMIVSLIAVLKAGAAYLPIDTEYPEERVDYMLRDSGTKIIVTNSLKVKKLEGPGTQTNKPTNLAYIIYTSGSTGKPKGVILEHRNLVNLLHYQYRHTTIDFSRVLQFTTISFDVSFQEIFSTLLCGGQLTLVSRETINDIPLLFEVIERNRLRTLFMPASFLKFIMNEEEYRDLLPRGVRHIVTAGEQVIVNDTFRQYLQSNGIYLHNHYGPSETHVVTTLTLDPSGEIPELPCIGKPVSNTGIHILDSGNHLQPVGIAGELVIAGAQVGRGYLNRPELTMNKFAFNPTAYRTGDLARWLPDGNIEFLGRADHQVKIRGFRVELGEIESRLLAHDKVNDAIVLAREDEKGAKYLCAYVVTSDRRDDLREYLSRELPDYMVPSYFVFLESIPLLPNRKPDRRSLPIPEREKSDGYIAPRTPVEEALAEIWAEVLEVGEDTVGIEDNFFEMGGHSLKATVLTVKVHKRLNVRIPLVEVFQRPTIAQLSRYIVSAGKDRYTAIPPAEKREYYPLSPAQKRLHILYQVEPGNTAYNMPRLISLPDRVDTDEVERVFRSLIRRHESFRTSFFTLEGESMQRVHDDVAFGVERFGRGDPLWSPSHGNHSGHPVSRVEGSHRGLPLQSLRDFVRPFDLSRAPLLRVGMMEPGGNNNNGYILIVDIHHIITDGVSQDILTGDFMKLYHGETLEPLQLQYKDFSQWRNREKHGDHIRRQEDYWLREFAGDIPLLNLPTDYPRSGTVGFGGGGFSFTIPGPLSREIKESAFETGVTPMMVLISVYSLLLSKFTNRQDIVVGTVVAGRRHADLQNIIGFFVNMLAIRTAPAKDLRFPDYLNLVKEKSLQAYENQDYPFEELVAKLDIPRQPGRHPLVEAVFLFTEGGDEEDEHEHESGTGTGASNALNRSHFDLMLHALTLEDSIRMNFEYSTSLFKEDTIREFARYYMEILEQVTTDMDCRLGELTLSHGFATSSAGVLTEDDDDWDLE